MHPSPFARRTPTCLDRTPAGSMRRIALGSVLATLLAFAIASPPALARVPMQASIHLLGAFPMGEMADEVDNAGVGLGGGFLVRVPQSPLLIGGDLAFFVYGETERTSALAGFPEVRIRVTTTNNIVQGGLVLRLQPAEGPLLPYLDGLIGFNYLYTQSKLSGRRDLEDFASDTNQDDIAFAAGGGAGLLIRLHQKKEPGPGLQAVHLDLRGRYLAGGQAEYLDEGSMRVEEGRLLYKLIHSRTDLVQAGAGVTFQF